MITASNRHTLIKHGEFFIVNRSKAHSLVRADEANILLVLQFSPNFCREYYLQLASFRMLQNHVAAVHNPKLYKEPLENFVHMFRSMVERKEGYQLSLMASLNYIADAIGRYGEYENRSNAIRIDAPE